ncbi:hypothetical protein [Janthinobacterium sp. J1-1]|uniref:hypothetical protein n=1 Tax=Janthinobacterium sp. J1-1 TaxID=3065910 RepID=UPI002811FC1D|nr:hypothetical protein [Janthinobacterium sp. J1-1]
MSGRPIRGEAECQYTLALQCADCAACAQRMPTTYTKTRKLVTMHGLIQLRLQIRRCENAQCPRFHQVCHPEEEGRWALPKQEFSFDVVLRVGQLRYREHRSCPEIFQQLRQEGVDLAERSVSNLLTQYDILLSLALDTVSAP